YSIMASLQYDEISLVTMHAALKLKTPIPIVDVKTQAVTEEELPKVFEIIDANPELQAIVLKGHGIVAIGDSAVKAGQTAELIEETAKIFWELKK
ncbi:MAG: class II aldolase/adducin family protein, partial [Ruminiclostridium sp.]